MRWSWPNWASSGVAIIWLAGATVCLTICIVRILKFQRLLRFSVPGPREMQDRVDVLCKRLGMRFGPRVVLVSGPVCPMVWPAGRRATVLVPSALWDRLDARQRDTLLLHELAHLRRRDHWVRWFELLVTALYWWNPICWWARHELREAEEQCCDAWVMWALPGSFKQYASALLEAVEFVSVRPSAPLLASGMGQFGDLRRRLTMIKQGEVARALTWSGFAAACGAGALLLSFAPTLAQNTEPKDEKPTETVPVPVTVAPAPVQESIGNNNKPDQPSENVDKKNEATPAAAPLQALPPTPARPRAGAPLAPGALPALTPASVAPLRVESGDSSDLLDDPSDDSDDGNFRRDMQRQKADQQRQQADAQRQQADAQRQQAQQQRQLANSKRDLERARRDVAELSNRLAEASDRLKKLEMQNAQAQIGAKFPANQYAQEKIGAKFPANQFDIETRDGKIVTIRPKDVPDGAVVKINPDGSGYRALVGPKGADKGGYAVNGPLNVKGRSSGDDRERRLEAVERELSQLLKEVRQLRDEKETTPRPPEPRAK